VMGGVGIVVFGLIAVAGVRISFDNKVDLADSRNLLVAAITLVLGTGDFTLKFFGFTIGGIGTATVGATILNAVLSRGSRQVVRRMPVREIRESVHHGGASGAATLGRRHNPHGEGGAGANADREDDHSNQHLRWPAGNRPVVLIGVLGEDDAAGRASGEVRDSALRGGSALSIHCPLLRYRPVAIQFPRQYRGSRTGSTVKAELCAAGGPDHTPVRSDGDDALAI
jgi:hypothetical protein